MLREKKFDSVEEGVACVHITVEAFNEETGELITSYKSKSKGIMFTALDPSDVVVVSDNEPVVIGDPTDPDATQIQTMFLGTMSERKVEAMFNSISTSIKEKFPDVAERLELLQILQFMTTVMEDNLKSPEASTPGEDVDLGDVFNLSSILENL